MSLSHLRIGPWLGVLICDKERVDCLGSGRDAGKGRGGERRKKAGKKQEKEEEEERGREKKKRKVREKENTAR